MSYSSRNVPFRGPSSITGGSTEGNRSDKFYSLCNLKSTHSTSSTCVADDVNELYWLIALHVYCPALDEATVKITSRSFVLPLI